MKGEALTKARDAKTQHNKRPYKHTYMHTKKHTVNIQLWAQQYYQKSLLKNQNNN